MAFICEESVKEAEERKKLDEILRKINELNKKNFWRFKRILDVIFATLLLIFAAIPMLFIALVIFLSDGHNPIYIQERIGRYGLPFNLYKFRTMVPDADKMTEKVLVHNEMDGPVFKMAGDPRITKIGKFLRKTGLDELPQLFNVLKGNMTLIGPRPPLPREVAQYSEYHKIRLLVTPGITCIWQVQPKRNSIPFERWVEMDVDYVLHRNLWLDMKIAFMTVVVMLSGEGE